MNFPFDKRNLEDYIAISERLRSGLARIAEERSQSGEYKHAASSKVLAQLVGCSVATVYARQGSTAIDPVAALRSIKAARLEEQRLNRVTRNPRPRITKDHLRNVGEHIDANAKLRVGLSLALDEATRWNHLHAEITFKHRALITLNNRLIEKIAVLEKRISELMQQLEQSPKSSAIGEKSTLKVTQVVHK